MESINKIAGGIGVPLSTLFKNIESTAMSDRSCAAEAYELIQSLPYSSQEKILLILKTIVEIK